MRIKSKQILLAALLMVVMAALLTVSASAAPKLNKKKLTLKVGKTARLSVKGTKQKVKWSSSDDNVASVSEGKVTAWTAGKATIKAKVGGKTLKCKVTVVANAPTPSVNIAFPTCPITYVYDGITGQATFTIEKIEYVHARKKIFITAVKTADNSQFGGTSGYIKGKIYNSNNVFVQNVSCSTQSAGIGDRFETDWYLGGAFALAPGNYRFEFTANLIDW